MNAAIKYLIFKGIERKEQILFKSFLNLAKNDMNYQIVVLNESSKDSNDPDIVILGDSYQFSDEEQRLKQLPTVTVGDDINNESASYIVRPVQWSDLKSALASLSESVRAEPVEPIVERMLPQPTNLAIEELSDLSSVSVSQHSATSHDQDNEENQSLLSGNELEIQYDDEVEEEDLESLEDAIDLDSTEAVILIADDESGSSNSVLVIETDSLEVWSQHDLDILNSEAIMGANANGDYVNELMAEKEETVEPRIGEEIDYGESYWKKDNELIVNQKSLLFVKAGQAVVYSETAPGNWFAFLHRDDLSKLALASEWEPTAKMRAYPVESLIWADTFVNKGSQLLPSIEEEQEYVLQCWPKFELLELDNSLLKLCSMLFIRPETVDSLAQRSGFGRSTVRGLMNACYQAGILKLPHEVQSVSKDANAQQSSMLGKIKNVFS